MSKTLVNLSRPCLEALNSERQKIGDNDFIHDAFYEKIANNLIGIFSQVCGCHCADMNLQDLLEYIEDKMNFHLSDAIYFEKITRDEALFLFQEKLPAVIESNLVSKLSISKRKNGMKYASKIIFGHYIRETAKVSSRFFSNIIDAVNTLVTKDKNTCTIMVMRVFEIHLREVEMNDEVKFKLRTKYARKDIEYQIRDEYDYEKIMILKISVVGLVSKHTEYLFGPYPVGFVEEEEDEKIVVDF